MAFCCSQCSFTAQFESALLMHHQLHHENNNYPDLRKTKPFTENSSSLARLNTLDPSYLRKEHKGIKLASRQSATRLFGKLRAKICRSKMLFSHPEEVNDHSMDLSAASECTSKALKADSTLSKSSAFTTYLRDVPKETYSCHLCSFEADRITVLDRHLLNDHKIGLDNLLKLVMIKTKEGISQDPDNFTQQPYYISVDETNNGEFIYETVEPNIKILKHAATNTDVYCVNLKDNCHMITKELDELVKCPMVGQKDDLLEKMQILNECMCKFADSTNTLKRVLTKQFDCKSARHCNCDETMFDLALGDQETPREWNRAHSETHKQSRSIKSRCGKSKLSANSFYF